MTDDLQLVSPPDQVLSPIIQALRASYSHLGAAKLLLELKRQHPEWTLSEKRFKKLLSLPPTVDGVLPVGETEYDLVAVTNIDPTLNVDVVARKVKVRMFGNGKGKGLVAKEKILQGEVLWQEDPWIITADPQLHDPLAQRAMCSQCFLLFPQPNPPMSVPCPHCNSAHFCNRLCLARARSSSAHLDLLCPSQNPGAAALLNLIHSTNSRHMAAVAKIVALWRGAREWDEPGRAEDVEKRVWSMARVNEEKREMEKKEWEYIGENRHKNWRQAHAALISALHPSVADPNHAAFTKLLASRRSRKTKAKALTTAEIERWFSYDSYLELLGLAALNQEDSGGLYALHAHINHSCEPNVSARNLPKSYTAPKSLPCDLPPPREKGGRGTNRLTILARRTIHPGEELTLSYANPAMPRSLRRRHLREQYGFWCTCTKCQREQGKAEDESAIKDMEANEMINQLKGLSATNHGEAHDGECASDSMLDGEDMIHTHHVHGDECNHGH